MAAVDGDLDRVDLDTVPRLDVPPPDLLVRTNVRLRFYTVSITIQDVRRGHVPPIWLGTVVLAGRRVVRRRTSLRANSSCSLLKLS